jgi:hypothetical protein
MQSTPLRDEGTCKPELSDKDDWMKVWIEAKVVNDGKNYREYLRYGNLRMTLSQLAEGHFSVCVSHLGFSSHLESED